MRFGIIFGGSFLLLAKLPTLILLKPALGVIAGFCLLAAPVMLLGRVAVVDHDAHEAPALEDVDEAPNFVPEPEAESE